jgi:hypothetical protein
MWMIVTRAAALIGLGLGAGSMMSSSKGTSHHVPPCSYSGGIFLDQSIFDCGDRTAGHLMRVLRTFDSQEPLSLDDCG